MDRLFNVGMKYVWIMYVGMFKKIKNIYGKNVKKLS